MKFDNGFDTVGGSSRGCWAHAAQAGFEKCLLDKARDSGVEEEQAMAYYRCRTLEANFDDSVRRTLESRKAEGFGVPTDIDVKKLPCNVVAHGVSRL